MPPMKVAIIVPTFRALDYAEGAVESALRHTPDAHVLLIDDATPEWEPKRFSRFYGGGRFFLHRFKQNRGVTRSWNHGLKVARTLGCDAAVCGNSDVWFPKGWCQTIRYWRCSCRPSTRCPWCCRPTPKAGPAVRTG